MRHVIKRDQSREPINFNKVTKRIKSLCFPNISSKYGFTLKNLENVKFDEVAQATITGIYDNIKTSDLDKNAAIVAQSMSLDHPEYGELASRLLINNHHKETVYVLSKYFKLSIIEIQKYLYYYTCRALYENVEIKNSPLISPILFALVTNKREEIEEILDYSLDYFYDYYGFTYLQEKYLLHRNTEYGIIMERPQHMLMRVAIGIHLPVFKSNINLDSIPELKDYLAPYTLQESIEHILQTLRCKIPIEKENSEIYKVYKKVKELVKKQQPSWGELYLQFTSGYEINWSKVYKTYYYLAQHYFSQATPTYYNAGTLIPQMSSCFLVMNPTDSINGIAQLWQESALISKHSGGIGSHHHIIRSNGSYIHGTGGYSNGLTPMLRVINNISLYVDQGGKRPGTHAIYIEPWHADIFDILALKKSRGNENERARNLFYGLWIPDEFMRCLYEEYRRNDGSKLWYLMCPSQSGDLSNYYDEDFITDYVSDDDVFTKSLKFTRKYRKCIQKKLYKQQISAIDLWKKILQIIIETGIPYILFKDACNRKSNQKNLGTIRSSNLCTEIIEFSSPEEIAVCNLMSLCLPRFVIPYDGSGENYNGKTFDWQLFSEAIKLAVYNMNEIIDNNFYPIRKTEYSNFKHRPIALGVQGLADLFAEFKIPFDSEKAKQLNFYLFEFLYYHALQSSMKLAYKKCKSYDSFAGSPLSKGLFQHDLWVKERSNALCYPLKQDWEKLRKKILDYGIGVYNSLLIALMPTSSVSDINGFSPCFEPYSGMIYKRRRNIEIEKINKYLIEDLMKCGLWNKDIKNKILQSHTGSIADIKEIPEEIRNIYKTVWDLSIKVMNEMALIRAPFIDQSQSLSQFIKTPTISNLTQLHNFNWRHGAKTSSYYTRRLSPVDPQKIQIQECSEVCTSCQT